MGRSSGQAQEKVLACSFCGKSQQAAGKLISSPSSAGRAYICDECVAVCNAIIEDDRGEGEGEAAADESPFLAHPAVAELLTAVERWLREDLAGGDAGSALAEVRLVGRRILLEMDLK